MRELRLAAERLLRSNVRRGVVGGQEYVYICPSRSVYHHQWLWDSCFHAIVMARFDGDLAKAELRTLLSQVALDGFLPHLTNWIGVGGLPGVDALARGLFGQGHHRRLTQPPVVGIAAEEVHRHTGDRGFIRETLPAIKRYYRHLAATRDPDGDGLLSIIFPIESGMDHSPAFDAALGLRSPGKVAYHVANLRLLGHALRLGWNVERILAADRFAVEDAGFNAIYAEGLRSTARLCAIDGDEDAEDFDRRASRVENALLSRCYNARDGLFYSLAGHGERQLRVKTVTSLLPLMLQNLPSGHAAHLAHQIRDPRAFGAPYPVPSVALDEPSFAPDGHALPVSGTWRGRLHRQWAKYQLIWRGPTWINTNWFIVRGLRRHGYGELADEITLRTAEMVQSSGFWEFYNPLTGKGLGAEHFGWSTLIVDMLDAMEQTPSPALVV